MKKRFKTKIRRKHLKRNILLIIILIFISSYITYNIFYVSYLSKLTNKEIINHIIEETKNNKSTNTIIEQYKNPHIILSNNFSIIEKPTLEVNNIDKTPTVYIYSTHETESYKDKYLEAYNIKPTVKLASYILKDYLDDYGITSIVEDKSITEILRNNKWSYKYSYEASRIAIKDTIEANKSLKLIIDLHRDSSNLNKTLLEVNNIKYARILFVVGGENKNYKENLLLAEKLKELLEQEQPNITRGITTKKGVGVNGIYNQDLSNKSVLIELGGQYNEIEEINNTIKILSKVILKYIEGEQ